MDESEQKNDEPAQPHVVYYDHLNPSPLFTSKQVEFIESVSKFLSDEDLKTVREYEWFALNLNWLKFQTHAKFGYGIIPGLRQEAGIGTLYVKRYSKLAFVKLIDEFLDHVPEGFPPGDVDRWRVPGVRVTAPNGDRYYPYVFNGNLEQWRIRLLRCAERRQTLIGEFIGSKFALSNGQSLEFSALKIERMESRDPPKNW